MTDIAREQAKRRRTPISGHYPRSKPNGWVKIMYRRLARRFNAIMTRKEIDS